MQYIMIQGTRKDPATCWYWFFLNSALRCGNARPNVEYRCKLLMKVETAGVQSRIDGINRIGLNINPKGTEVILA
jgi:hypothetical protein